jgi:hypothetical protein
MTREDFDGIVTRLIKAKWNRWSPAESEVLWKHIHAFEDSALSSAIEDMIFGWAKGTKPEIEQIVRLTAKHSHRRTVERVECADCGRRGLLSVAIKCNPITGERDWANMRHPLDDATCGPGWYVFAIPCNCENAPRQGDTDWTRKALTALRQFEATFKRSHWADARNIVMGLREGTTPETRHEKVERLFDAPQEMPPVAAVVTDGDEIPF